MIDVEEYEGSEPRDFASLLRSALDPVAGESSGFSGRTLRKLPFIAFAIFIRSSTKPKLNDFVIALKRAVQRQKDERNHIPA